MTLPPFDWRADLREALTLHQAKNHAYHILGAAVIAGLFRHFVTSIGWFGIPAVIIIVLAKEIIESLYKTWLSKPRKFFDPILDTVGWGLGAIVGYQYLPRLLIGLAQLLLRPTL